MSDGMAPVSDTPSDLARPEDALTQSVIYYWEGQDIRTLKRAKLLQIIGILGGEVRELREKNTQLERVKFYRR